MGVSGGPQVTKQFPWTAVALARLGRLGCTAQLVEGSADVHGSQCVAGDVYGVIAVHQSALASSLKERRRQPSCFAACCDLRPRH